MSFKNTCLPLGMYPVGDNVSEWKEGSSYGPEPVLWRRKCINNTTGRCKSLWSMFLYMLEFLVLGDDINFGLLLLQFGSGG